MEGCRARTHPKDAAAVSTIQNGAMLRPERHSLVVSNEKMRVETENTLRPIHLVHGLTKLYVANDMQGQSPVELGL